MENKRSVRIPKDRGSSKVALADKLRGGYYTPADVAKWLCDWAIQSPTDRILEPSSGDGVFLEAAATRLGELGSSSNDIAKQIVGVELDEREVVKARHRLESTIECPTNGAVIADDFFKWSSRDERRFECAVGNPPFIRYQSFPEPSRQLAMQLLTRAGLKPNRLTNIWVPFVVGAIQQLVVGGRLAFVLPAELLQVTYAGQLRSFLADSFERIEIIACNHLFFEHAEQEVLLVLADGFRGQTTDNGCAIEMVEVPDLAGVLTHAPLAKSRRSRRKVNHDSEKWLKYFLSAREISFMRSLKTSSEIAALGEHASIDIGVVTGKNQFFVVSEDQVKQHRLQRHVVPLVGRSAHLRGAVVSSHELSALQAEGHRVFLFSNTQKNKSRLGKKVNEYLRQGESQGFHLGYKCSIRTPWYAVPGIWEPDAFFFRQIYDFPRAVLNQAEATSTDTIHRMRCHTDAKRVVENVYTHLTAASAEIEGRSYGGGVLELEPTESERLLMPGKLQHGLDICEVDQLVRNGDISEVLAKNDRLILQDQIGLTKRECAMLQRVWNRMKNRRNKRRKTTRHSSRVGSPL